MIQPKHAWASSRQARHPSITPLHSDLKIDGLPCVTRKVPFPRPDRRLLTRRAHTRSEKSFHFPAQRAAIYTVSTQWSPSSTVCPAASVSSSPRISAANHDAPSLVGAGDVRRGEVTGAGRGHPGHLGTRQAARSAPTCSIGDGAHPSRCLAVRAPPLFVHSGCLCRCVCLSVCAPLLHAHAMRSQKRTLTRARAHTQAFVCKVARQQACMHPPASTRDACMLACTCANAHTLAYTQAHARIDRPIPTLHIIRNPPLRLAARPCSLPPGGQRGGSGAEA
jgi:hypothetical protein